MPPKEFRLNTKPSQAAQCLPDLKASESGTIEASAEAVTKSYPRDGFQPVRQIVSVMPGDQLLLDRLESLSQSQTSLAGASKTNRASSGRSVRSPAQVPGRHGPFG